MRDLRLLAAFTLLAMRQLGGRGRRSVPALPVEGHATLDTIGRKHTPLQQLPLVADGSQGLPALDPSGPDRLRREGACPRLRQVPGRWGDLRRAWVWTPPWAAARMAQDRHLHAG